MALLRESPPKRPAPLKFDSISELYKLFGDLFLAGDGIIVSPCGHQIHCLKHHFFHLAGVEVEGKSRLFIKYEEEEIVATTDGVGKYKLRQNGSRAKRLMAALLAFQEPDEVWTGNTSASAKWVYVKEFESEDQYSFSVAFVTESENELREVILVPTSCFFVTRVSLGKWRKGTLIYPETRTATIAGDRREDVAGL
jgi:hypothetical protein